MSSQTNHYDAKSVKRRIQTENPSVCVLEVKTKPLENLYLENPDALSESSQLFQIGMLLIEIALQGRDYKEVGKSDDPYLYASNKLPLVHGSIGSRYYKACAFSDQDRRSTPSYGRAEKYQYPEKTGWDAYLKDMLEDYYIQVVSG